MFKIFWKGKILLLKRFYTTSITTIPGKSKENEKKNIFFSSKYIHPSRSYYGLTKKKHNVIFPIQQIYHRYVLIQIDVIMFFIIIIRISNNWDLYLPLISNDEESFSGFPLLWNRSFMRVLGLVVEVTVVCSCCWVVIASNAVVLPSNKPWRGSIVGKELFTLDDGESVWVVLLILVVRPSWPASKEHVVSPLGILVTFVNELLGVRRSSILYLKWISIQ